MTTPWPDLPGSNLYSVITRRQSLAKKAHGMIAANGFEIGTGMLILSAVLGVRLEISCVRRAKSWHRRTSLPQA
jgi:hypothetical protein